MHPTFSIVFFTTASGAGFALLALVGLGVPLGLCRLIRGSASRPGDRNRVCRGRPFSSVFHLGRPNALARAFTMALVMAVARGRDGHADVYPDGDIWDRLGVLRAIGGVIGLCGVLAAASALGTIYCTGMIYASLKPIHQCTISGLCRIIRSRVDAGFLLLDVIDRFWVPAPVAAPLLGLITVLLAWWLKEQYWRFIDTTSAPSTVESATALGAAARYGCWSRRIPRRTTSSRKWAFASPGNTRSGCG